MELTYKFASKSTYTFKKKVGSGGSAEVFLYSRQAEGLPNQDVVLKVLKSADESGVRELLNEGRRLGMLKHPNILTAFGYEKIDDQKFGLVLEYFPGENLKKIIPRIKIEQRPLVAEYVVKTLCEALSLAHSQEIIHGDLSGRNVLVSHQGQIKLSDFGLACRPTLQGRSVGVQIKGSADYLAPERWQGGAPSLEADIFSLGILAFEILNGENPLSGGSCSSGLSRTLQFLQSENWNRFPAWRRFFEGCLNKKPKDRIGASELLKFVPLSGFPVMEIQRYLEGMMRAENTHDRVKTETQVFSKLLSPPPSLQRWAAIFFILFLMAPGAIGQDHSSSGRLKPCLLTLTSQPWGEIVIDGVSRGYTPFINFPVPAGAHVVVWRNPLMGTVRKTLRAFENGTLAYKISKEHGRLQTVPLESFQLK